MHLRLYASPTVQIGGGTDTSLPIYRCAINVEPLRYGPNEVTSSTIGISHPGPELRTVLAAAPLGATAELRDASGSILFAGVVQGIVRSGQSWSVTVEV